MLFSSEGSSAIKLPLSRNKLYISYNKLMISKDNVMRMLNRKDNVMHMLSTFRHMQLPRWKFNIKLPSFCRDFRSDIFYCRFSEWYIFFNISNIFWNCSHAEWSNKYILLQYQMYAVNKINGLFLVFHNYFSCIFQHQNRDKFFRIQFGKKFFF